MEKPFRRRVTELTEQWAYSIVLAIMKLIVNSQNC